MAGSVGSEDGDVGFQIAPMVDVVFVLMLFFMASAGMQVVEKELGINLPSGGVAGRGGPPPTPIIVEIGDNGQIALNNSAYDNPQSKQLPELRGRLELLIEQFGTENPVIIRPSMQVTHERIMDVLNAAAASGVKNLTFS